MSTVHPPQKNDAEILDFTSFIKKYFDWYEIDGFNLKIIQQVGLWATRNKKFNNIEPGWHIDRGLLIWGNPGSGKDEMFRLLNQYLNYLNSKYYFDHRVVWKFADKFSHKENGGYKVFDEEGKTNRYYEELALTNEATGFPDREQVQHFANKILIGAELIHLTHNSFKNYGLMAHFSTNLDEDKLKSVYGERVYSRLKYMCNFIKMSGKDRRKEEEPVFLKNINQPAPPPQPRELDVREHEDNKSILEGYYQDFLQEKNPSIPMALMYDTLIAYDVKVATDDQLRELMDKHEKTYVSDAPALRLRTASEKETYKKSEIWKRSKESAVKHFFQVLKDNNAKTIFGEYEPNLPNDRRSGSTNVSELIS